MDTQVSKRTVSYLVAVGFVLLILVLFTGATHMNDSQVGRYRMSVVIRNSFTDIFVIDTTTGVIKYVGKDEGKPFEQIKGK